MEQVYKSNGILFKLLPCLLIVMFLLMCLYGSRVYAVSVDNSYTYTVQNNSDYVFDLSPLKDLHYLFVATCRPSDYNAICYVLCVSSSPISIGDITVDYSVEFSSDSPIYLTDGKSYSVEDIQSYIDNANSILASSSTYSRTCYFKNSATAYDTISIDDIVVSCNYDVLSIEDDSVVFQGAPQEVEQILAPIVETQEMKPLEEILQILPIVIVVVVSCLGLRKGLKILKTFLAAG